MVVGDPYIGDIKMSKKKYPISIEVSGRLAMFSRPDTGSERKSYIAPPMSAAKGLLESIFFYEYTNVIPVAVKICSKPVFMDYSYTYGGLLRKSDLISSGDSQKIKESVLENVRYQIFAMVETAKYHPVHNPAHAHQAQFMRNIAKSACRKTPFLGREEMVCDYWGPLLPDTSPVDINKVIPCMLRSVFDKKKNGSVNPSYLLDVEVSGGILEYDHGLSKVEVEKCLMS